MVESDYQEDGAVEGAAVNQLQGAWLAKLIASMDSEQHSPFGDVLPRFPSEQMQVNTTGLSSAAGLRQAHAFYSDVKRECEAIGRPLREGMRMLDFGSGWGRVTRMFMNDLRAADIRGIDVDKSFVDLSREIFTSVRFDSCAPFPPTDIEGGSLDLIVSYSVFSHLSESACIAWMAEFSRLLSPGGIVAWTTRDRTFFDYCEWAASQGEALQGYSRALGELFEDLTCARRSYDSGRIVHASSEGVGGGGPRDKSFYGETFIPEEYARSAFADGFNLISSCFDQERYDQRCFVFQKK